MATTALRTVITAIESQLSTPSLGLTFASTLGGLSSMPSQRGATAIYVSRTDTANLDEESRNQVEARATDSVEVGLLFRLSPKAQRATRDAAYDKADEVRNRLTALAFRPSLGITWIDESEDVVEGECIRITQRYRITRYQQIGAG